MKPKVHTQITTIKLEKDLYDEFKILGIKSEVSLQALVEKCMYLYVNDTSFRNTVENFEIPALSTSGPYSIS